MRRIALVLLACLAGLAASEMVYRSVVCRDWIGRCFDRGHLRALVNGTGVYDRDLERSSPENLAAETAARAVDAALRDAARDEPVAAPKVAREYDLLHWQFASERLFTERMRASGYLSSSLTSAVSNNLKARLWIEQQIASRLTVSDEQRQDFYRAHRDAFVLPQRFRANHIFLAAPPEAPLELVESKQLLIDQLSKRLQQGEAFSDLVTEASEDEATKWRGGDLGFFAESRMLPEIFAAAGKLQAGQLSKPIRSHLGFHILQLTAAEPARTISLEEARAEISAILQNAQRRFLTGELIVKLTGKAEYFGVSR